MIVALRHLRLALRSTDEPAHKRFVRSVLRLPWDPERPVGTLELVQTLLADWLAHLSFLTDAQQHEVVQWAQPELEGFAQALEAFAGKDEQPLFTLAIADCQWVSCRERPVFLDITESVEVEQLPRLAVTHIMCDLTALYLQTLRRLEVIQRTQNTLGRDAHYVPGRSNLDGDDAHQEGDGRAAPGGESPGDLPGATPERGDLRDDVAPPDP